MCPTCNHPKLNYEPQLSLQKQENIYRCPKCRNLTDSDEVDALMRKQYVPHFSPRERQIIVLISGGADNNTICDTLGIKENTAKNYISTILSKTGMKRAQLAVAFATGRFKL